MQARLRRQSILRIVDEALFDKVNQEVVRLILQ